MAVNGEDEDPRVGRLFAEELAWRGVEVDGRLREIWARTGAQVRGGK